MLNIFVLENTVCYRASEPRRGNACLRHQSSRTSNCENIRSNSHSYVEYVCSVSLKSLH